MSFGETSGIMQKSSRRFLFALHDFGGGRAGWRAGSEQAAACGRIILAGAARNLLALEAHVISIYSEGIPELSLSLLFFAFFSAIISPLRGFFNVFNRSVYASPPVGGSGYGLPRSFRYAPFPRQTSATFCRPWKCYAFPYPGRQNVIYSRNAKQNPLRSFCLTLAASDRSYAT
jgi:hypothetical protein